MQIPECIKVRIILPQILLLIKKNYLISLKETQIVSKYLKFSAFIVIFGSYRFFKIIIKFNINITIYAFI